MLYPGSLMFWTSLALHWPQLAGGYTTDGVISCQSTLRYNKTGLSLEVTCNPRVNLQYNLCIWDRKRSDGDTEMIASKRLFHTNSKINNECQVSVPLSKCWTSGTSPLTPLFTLGVRFEASGISLSRNIGFTLPQVNAGKCQLSHLSTTAAGTCKQLAFDNQYLPMNKRLEEYIICTTNVLDTGKFFWGILFDLEREHECLQRDTDMKRIFEVDMRYVKSLALLTISASGLHGIRVEKTYTLGSKWFRFDLSFTRPGQSDRQADRQTVAIRFLFQRHNLEPLLVECVRPVTDCQKPAVLTPSTRRTTGRTNPVTIVAAILGGLLIILLVMIAVVVICVRHHKPVPEIREECHMTVQNNLYTGVNHCVTGSFGSDDGNLPADENPTEEVLYYTINDLTQGRLDTQYQDGLA